jgi:hypothetical protein
MSVEARRRYIEPDLQPIAALDAIESIALRGGP